jgi:hypothetical protein
MFSNNSPSANNLLDIPFVSELPNISHSNPIHIKSNPQWGCMKGGQLPTYRHWRNQTQRNNPSLENMQMTGHQNNVNTNTEITEPIPISSIRNSFELRSPEFSRSPPIYSKPVLDRDTNEMKQIASKMAAINDAKEKYKIKYGKQKKTIRKTYTLGKSKVTPKVSVLISNKTVRKNISTKKEKLKQVPIDEIRKVLIKRGFIKVGSLATNDVLRKMYESMLLVCGEVENHNPDNLLYNYLHAT